MLELSCILLLIAICTAFLKKIIHTRTEPIQRCQRAKHYTIFVGFVALPGQPYRTLHRVIDILSNSQCADCVTIGVVECKVGVQTLADVLPTRLRRYVCTRLIDNVNTLSVRKQRCLLAQMVSAQSHVFFMSDGLLVKHWDRLLMTQLKGERALLAFSASYLPNPIFPHVDVVEKQQIIIKHRQIHALQSTAIESICWDPSFVFGKADVVKYVSTSKQPSIAITNLSPPYKIFVPTRRVAYTTKASTLIFSCAALDARALLRMGVDDTGTRVNTNGRMGISQNASEWETITKYGSVFATLRRKRMIEYGSSCMDEPSIRQLTKN